MRIIFHHPLPLDANAKSASGIRPLCMLKAFQDLGYEVDLVTGYAQERKEAINRIKSNLKQGVKYDFVYAESSTMPTTLTERHHLPTHPFLDFNFFRLCKKNNIPIGLFYRDIYWMFDEYAKGVGPIKTFFAKIAYKFDLFVYKKTITKLYLPSVEMGKFIPNIDSTKIEALPPGHMQAELLAPKTYASNSLKLFYVGGMSDHYRLHKLFSILVETPEVEFVLCTRQDEWDQVRREYPKLTSNIKIIHESGEAMRKYLSECDIAVLCVESSEYWTFASPVKLYEYLGAGKPILSSRGTLTGEFVESNGVGWVVPYDETELRRHLKLLLENPEMVVRAKEKLAIVAPHHTWQARAKQVCAGLSK